MENTNLLVELLLEGGCGVDDVADPEIRAHPEKVFF